MRVIFRFMTSIFKTLQSYANGHATKLQIMIPGKVNVINKRKNAYSTIVNTVASGVEEVRFMVPPLRRII